MTGDIRGIVPIEAGGETYRLQFTVNGMCALEEETGESLLVFFKRMQGSFANGEFRISDVRMLIWAGLQEHHDGLTVKEAGRLVQEAGGPEVVMEHLERAVVAASPDDKKAAGGGKKKRATAA